MIYYVYYLFLNIYLFNTFIVIIVIDFLVDLSCVFKVFLFKVIQVVRFQYLFIEYYNKLHETCILMVNVSDFIKMT